MPLLRLFQAAGEVSVRLVEHPPMKRPRRRIQSEKEIFIQQLEHRIQPGVASRQVGGWNTGTVDVFVRVKQPNEPYSDSVAILRAKDGRTVEGWNHFGFQVLAQQIGAGSPEISSTRVPA